MAYLLDTDWIINALAGKRHATTTIDHLAPRGLAVSVIALGEIYEVAFESVNPQAHLDSFRQFLASFRLVGLSDPTMERFAEIRAALRRQGQLIPDLDILLAATALHHDLTLLTRNLKHFERIPDLKLYHPRLPSN